MNFKRSVERTLFGSRYILVLFYVGLIITLVCYGFIFAKQTFHMVATIGEISAEAMMLTALELVDMVMIATLIKMIFTGSYHAFVSKDHEYKDEKASSGLLKVKLSTSLVGVTGIHLLQTFIAINTVNIIQIISWDTLLKQLSIHGTFLIGSLILSVIEYLHEKGEYLNALIETKEELLNHK
ncbi:MAG: YqhA family protein [Bacteroidia bacterium]